MSEQSDEERQEQAALLADKTAWKHRDEELRLTACKTNAERAAHDIYQESHRVAGEKIDKRAKDYEVRWGRSAF
jgi:hypothetical protein